MDQLTAAGPTLDRDPELFANRYRRLILRYFVNSSDPSSIADLVDDILEHPSIDHQTNQERIHIPLRHTHHPQLEAHTLIDFDQRSSTVRYRPDDRIETILECLPDD